MTRSIFIGVSLFISMAASAADFVELRNGRRLEGVLVEQDDESVTMRLSEGAIVKIHKSSVASLHQDLTDREEPPVRPRMIPPVSREPEPNTPSTLPPETAVAPTATVEPAVPADPFAPASPQERDELKRYQTMLEDESEVIRKAAVAFLVKKGAKGGFVLSEMLKNKSVEARILAAEALGEMHDPAALKRLIDVFHATVPGGVERVRPSEVRLAYALRDALQKLSGLEIPIRPRHFQQDESVRIVLDWWKGPMDKSPRQFGEPFFSDDERPPVDVLRAWRAPGAQPPKTWNPEKSSTLDSTHAAPNAGANPPAPAEKTTP